MSNENEKSIDKNTVGQDGSSLEGGLEQEPEKQEQVTNNDLKGKKVDADLTNDNEKPADQ